MSCKVSCFFGNFVPETKVYVIKNITFMHFLENFSLATNALLGYIEFNLVAKL